MRIARRLALVFAAGWLTAAPAEALLTREDFVVKTTQDLIHLCEAGDDDPLRLAGIGFCHGYLVGAYQYMEALTDGPKGKRWVCPPSPPPKRAEAVQMFVDWSKAHPQYLQDVPVESLGRFLGETWPCPREKGGK